MAESKYATTSIQVPPSHLVMLQELARGKGVTVSAVVRWAITAYLLDVQRPPPDAPQT